MTRGIPTGEARVVHTTKQIKKKRGYCLLFITFKLLKLFSKWLGFQKLTLNVLMLVLKAV